MATQQVELNVNAFEFLKENKEYAINTFEMTEDAHVQIVEYAGKLFRHIRRNYVTER